MWKAWLAVLVLWSALAWHMWPHRCCRHISKNALALDDISQQDEHVLKGLDSKGFAVIPGWLSAEECESLLAIHEQLPPDAVGNAGRNVGFKTPDASDVNLFSEVPSLFSKLKKAISAIHKKTNIRLLQKNQPLQFHGIYLHTNYSVPNTLMFDWHQDHESYWSGYNHSRLLNFYVILAKEHPDEAGLQVVPFDLMRRQSPELWQLTRGGGAASFHDVGPEKMLATLDTNDDHLLLDFHLDNMSATPTLRAGDLLLMRGDMLHRTQPHRSWRTSLTMRTSIRVEEGAEPSLLGGGFVKYVFMAKAPFTYVSASGLEGLVMTLAIYGGFLYRLVLLPMRMALGLLLWEEVGMWNLFG